MKKSFNKNALRGDNYDDIQWQQDFASATGIIIPDEYLFTSKGPQYAIDQMYEQNKQDYQDYDGLSPEDASKQAEFNRKAALDDYKSLLSS